MTNSTTIVSTPNYGGKGSAIITKNGDVITATHIKCDAQCRETSRESSSLSQSELDEILDNAHKSNNFEKAVYAQIAEIF